MSPERVTVKVNGVLPLLPSARLTLAAAIESAGGASSLRMVPVAAAVRDRRRRWASDSVTVKFSSGSTWCRRRR